MNPEHIKTVLTNVAIRWLQESDQYDEDGNADCGTGSDAAYAMAQLSREHAQALEQIIDSII